MHVSSDSVILAEISFDELCKLRENWTLGNAAPVMTSASELFKKINKKSSLSPINIKCQQLYFAPGTY